MIPYGKPDPVKVAIITRDYGFDVACKRWASWSPKTIAVLGSEGRGILARRQREAA